MLTKSINWKETKYQYHKDNYRSSIRREYSGCPEVITENSMVLVAYMSTPLHQHAGQNRDTKIDNESFKYVAVLKYLGTTVTIISNKPCIYK
jgi:hypothetical protein